MSENSKTLTKVHIKRREWKGLLFILPSLLGVMVFYVLPFIQSLGYTFTQGIVNKKFVYFDNFTELFQSSAFRLAVKNTGLFILCAVPLLLLLSLVLSLLLKGGAHTVKRFALLAPMVIPGAAFLMGFRSIFHIVNTFLVRLNLPAVDFFQQQAFLLLIFIYLMKNVGYLTVIFSAAISTVPKEYQEVFQLDSSSKLIYIRRILLPLIAPMTFFAGVISVMNCFKIYREIYILYGDMPPKEIYMLQHFMNNNFNKLNYQRLSTAAFLVVALIAIFIWLFLRLQNRVRAE